MIKYLNLIDKNGEVYKENWPHLENEDGTLTKAVSPSTFGRALGWAVYGVMPPDFTHSGMTDGVEFENAIAMYITTGHISLSVQTISNPKLHDRFFEMCDKLIPKFGLSEEIEKNIVQHWNSPSNIFFASEIDILHKKKNVILEIKKTNTKALSKKKKKILKTMYLIQAFIQWKCFNKEVYLCWASDEFVKIEKYDHDKHGDWVKKVMSRLYVMDSKFKGNNPEYQAKIISEWIGAQEIELEI